MHGCNVSPPVILANVGFAFVLMVNETWAEDAPHSQAPRLIAESATPIRDRYLAKVSLFAPLEFHQDGRVLHCRLFIPRDFERSNLYPLVVWFHGYGESGDDNQRHLAYIQNEVARLDSRDGGFRCFVLAMQSGFDEHWNDSQLSDVLHVVRRSAEEWPVDEDRIYAAGVSSGGDACWRFAENYPDVFAAMAPMASRGTSNRTSLSRIPIWAFHSLSDPDVDASQVQATVAAIQAQGGACWLTLTSRTTHDCWTDAFRNYEAIAWLLQQRRGGPVVPPLAWANGKDPDRAVRMHRFKIALSVCVSIIVSTAIVVRFLANRRRVDTTDVSRLRVPQRAAP
jgi:poly(3-hydroxybutyrate) depolymerase